MHRKSGAAGEQCFHTLKVPVCSLRCELGKLRHMVWYHLFQWQWDVGDTVCAVLQWGRELVASLQPGWGCRVPGQPTCCISEALQRPGKLSTPVIKALGYFSLPGAILRGAAMSEKVPGFRSFLP